MVMSYPRATTESPFPLPSSKIKFQVHNTMNLLSLNLLPTYQYSETYNARCTIKLGWAWKFSQQSMCEIRRLGHVPWRRQKLGRPHSQNRGDVNDAMHCTSSVNMHHLQATDVVNLGVSYIWCTSLGFSLQWNQVCTWYVFVASPRCWTEFHSELLDGKFILNRSSSAAEQSSRKRNNCNAAGFSWRKSQWWIRVADAIQTIPLILQAVVNHLPQDAEGIRGIL